MKGSSLVGSLVDPEQNIFFLTVHHFTSFVTIAQQAGQAVVSRRLHLLISISVENFGPFTTKSDSGVAENWHLAGPYAVPAASRVSAKTNGVCDRLNLELSIRKKFK
jgi:hypothetical protein